MADTRLSIVVDAQDKASSTLAGIKTKVEGMQPAFKAMAVAGTVAFTAVSFAIKDTIDSANESARVNAQLAAVLKSTGGAAGLFADDLTEEATAMQKMTTYSDEAVLGMENLLLTFTNIKGAVFQSAVPAILDISTAMGTDLQSAAIQVGKALNDPIQGISALTRIGVTFSDSQKEVIKSLVETGQTAEAQRMIIAELTREFGGSAAAQAETFAGKIAQLNNRFDDIKEKIGNALIPILTDLATKMQPVIEKIANWIDQNPELVAQILIAVAAVAGIVAVVGTLGVLLPAVIAGFTALGVVLAFIAANPVILIIAAIALIAGVLKDQIAQLYGVKVTWLDVWNQIKGGFKAVTDWIADRLVWIMDKIAAVRSAYDKVTSAVGNAVSGALKTVGIKDGIVQNGNVITTDPADYIIATKNPSSLMGGGGITVNINGAIFSEDAARTLGDILFKQLNAQIRV